MRFHIFAPPLGAVAAWDHPASFRHMRGLLDRAVDAEHEVLVKDADLLSESAWFKQEAGSNSQLTELCERARATAWEDSGAGAEPVSTPAEAERARKLSHQPLGLLVESKLRDGALVDVLIRLFADKALKRLWCQAPVPPAVELLHGGGCGDFPALVRARREEAAQNGLAPRVVALLDSDRQSAESSLPAQVEKIRDNVKTAGGIPFIWSCRAAENLLPDRYWEGLRGLDPMNPSWTAMLDALLAMTTDERSFCDMGESGKGRKQVPAKYDRDKHRPYHLERMRSQLLQDLQSDPNSATDWAESFRARDSGSDASRLMTLIATER